MGTNYYWREPACESCDCRKDDVHIGKASAGWAFSFQALPKHNSPTGLAIESAKDWADVFTTCEGFIVDEYDAVVTPAEFWLRVSAWRGLKVHAKEYPSQDDYVDAEGHSFTREYFS